MSKWCVVPLCEKQLRDVNQEDILNGGLYRKCKTYKAGGGYDRFEEIYKRRTCSTGSFKEQFVVQLHGCPLRCPYCYVTVDGIHGDYVHVETSKLVTDFNASDTEVFHLMGGAPALYLNQWEELIEAVTKLGYETGREIPFHSDFLCVEGFYDIKVLSQIAAYDNTLFAVSVKGANAEEFKRNTGVTFLETMFWNNLEKLTISGVNFYITYTGMSKESIEEFEDSLSKHFGTSGAETMLQDSYSIQLVAYEALK